MKLTGGLQNDLELVVRARGSTSNDYLAALQRLLDAAVIWELPKTYQELALTYIEAGLIEDTRYN